MTARTLGSTTLSDRHAGASLEGDSAQTIDGLTGSVAARVGEYAVEDGTPWVKLGDVLAVEEDEAARVFLGENMEADRYSPQMWRLRLFRARRKVFVASETRRW